MSTVTWPTSDGATHEFSLCEQAGQWNAVAGIYIFAYLTPDGWHALYVGQTDNFNSRIPTHERWAEAVALRATHVHALVVSQAAMRDSLERKLIQDYQPPMNQQLR